MLAERFSRTLLKAVHRKSAPRQKQIKHEWAIGILTSNSLLDLREPGAGRNPVLVSNDVFDRTATNVADPFMIHRDGVWYMFFEAMVRSQGKAEIGVATSADGFTWTYAGIVLSEPFHLSYPYVFEWDGTHYMVPETHKAGEVRLYRATRFPQEWTHCQTLLSGGVYLDSSLIHFENRWWIFTETDPDLKWNTLRLFHAEDMFGAWTEHPMSPIVAGDARYARPAGRILEQNGKLYRFAQNCAAVYGAEVFGFEILEMTTMTYRERLISRDPILSAASEGWTSGGMHHIDVHHLEGGGVIACVDGWTPRDDSPAR